MTSEKKTILIIEDDMDIRELVAEILGDEGYNTKTAENGRIGLDYLLACDKNSLPDCVILDLMMPVMTGLQVMDYLLENHTNDLAKLPIIITTAKGNPREDLANMPVNVTKIRKPMDVNELIDTVAKHSSKKFV